MLNISKYHRAIVGCSAIATASFCGFAQSAGAAEQLNHQAVRVDQSRTLIAQVKSGGGLSIGSGGNKSNATGINVSNPNGLPINKPGIGSGGNKSNATGTNVENPGSPGIGNGGNRSNGTGTSSRGFNSTDISRATNIGARINVAKGNLTTKASNSKALEGAETTGGSKTLPDVRYSLVGDVADCGCPNADVVGSKNTSRPELVAAKAAEAEAAAELAAAQAEAREFLESVKSRDTAAVDSTSSSPLW
jgi:hypothetical protein